MQFPCIMILCEINSCLYFNDKKKIFTPKVLNDIEQVEQENYISSI